MASHSACQTVRGSTPVLERLGRRAVVQRHRAPGRRRGCARSRGPNTSSTSCQNSRLRTAPASSRRPTRACRWSPPHCRGASPDSVVPSAGDTAAPRPDGAVLPGDPGLVHRRVRGAHHRAGRRLDRRRLGAARARRRADRLRQDARRVPLGAGRAAVPPSRRARAAVAGRALPRPLRVAAQGTRRPTSSATCARRWSASGRPRPASGSRRRTSPWGCAPATPRRHERRAFAHPPAGHPHHHARSRSTSC